MDRNAGLRRFDPPVSSFQQLTPEPSACSALRSAYAHRLSSDRLRETRELKVDRWQNPTKSRDVFVRYAAGI